MKNTASKTLSLSAAIAVALGGFFATNAEAGHGKLVHLAHQLDGQLGTLKEELRLHYRHTPKFDHIMSDIVSMRKKARHIDALTHTPNVSLHHLEADVVEIDRLSHHLHKLVDNTEKSRNGHVHGNTRHVHTLLGGVTKTIHAMSGEIAVLKRPVRHYDRGYSSHDSHYRGQRPPQQQQQYRDSGRRFGHAGSSHAQGATSGLNPEAIRQWLFR